MAVNWMADAGTGVQNIGLALMIGGMLAIGAFAAPVIFRQFPREEAGTALTLIFRRYDIVLLVALGLVLAGEIARYLSGVFEANQTMNLVRYGLLVALTGLMLYSIQVVNAKIEAMHHQGVQRSGTPEGQEFHRVHVLSEQLYKIEMFLAMGLMVITPLVPRLLAN